ncbi:7-cyano-7-deazaguanine synthase [bacterium]|nr:7-cyano-7-deazaguanine synthase [candidate division CSSED10-310 bacterium]
MAGSIHNEVVTLFSGGMDSTLAVLDLTGRYERVHMLTFKTTGIVFAEHSRIHAGQLIREVGEDRLVHHIMDIRSIHRRIRRGLPEDYLRFCAGTAPGVLCMGCKLSMHVRTLMYCLDNGIAEAADGALRVQSDHPECMPEVLNELKRMYARYGVRFTSPMYDAPSKDDNRRRLLEHGFTVGKKFGSTTRFDQPICLVGPFSTMWHFSAPYDERAMVAFLSGKQAIVDGLIDEYMKNHHDSWPEHRPAPIPLDDEDLLCFREVRVQPEFGERVDHLISRALWPLWRLIDAWLRWSARRTDGT